MVSHDVGCSIMSMTTRSSRQWLSYGSDQADEQTTPAVVCALYKLNHNHMIQVQTWQNTLARDVVAKFGITPDDIVCRPCRDDIHRVTANPDHSPRWGKKIGMWLCAGIKWQERYREFFQPQKVPRPKPCHNSTRKFEVTFMPLDPCAV